MITLSIDVTLLDKKRIKEVKRKNGAIAKFVDLVLFETPNGQYGDYMVKQSVSKEERESGAEQLPILGNAKIMGRKNAQQEERPAKVADDEPPADDVPF